MYASQVARLNSAGGPTEPVELQVQQPQPAAPAHPRPRRLPARRPGAVEAQARRRHQPRPALPPLYTLSRPPAPPPRRAPCQAGGFAGRGAGDAGGLSARRRTAGSWRCVAGGHWRAHTHSLGGAAGRASRAVPACGHGSIVRHEAAGRGRPLFRHAKAPAAPAAAVGRSCLRSSHSCECTLADRAPVGEPAYQARGPGCWSTW